MGKELLQDPIFYRTISALENIVQVEAGFSALRALERGEIGDSDRVQVLTYLMQTGLTEVLKSKGIEPQAIIGHSVGEIAASFAAGCITAEEGAIIVSRRAKLYRRVQGQGGMVLVSLPFEKVDAQLRGRSDIVAAINSSPSSCVVSGQVETIEKYVEELGGRGIKNFRVNTDIAFHSPMLESLLDPLKDALAGSINPRLPSIPIYSTSCANPRTESLRDVAYWTSNMVNPVRLCEAVEAAFDDGMRIFLEVATHPIVSHSINDALSARNSEESVTIGIMERNKSPQRSIVQGATELHTAGVPVDYSSQLGRAWHSQVPPTPWFQKPYWKDVPASIAFASQQHDVNMHTLLGQNTQVADCAMRVFTTFLDDKTKPYPLTHPLDGAEIIPAAVYCNTFRQATGASILQGLQLITPTAMTADPREIQVVIKDQTAQLFSRTSTSQKISEQDAQNWTKHSSCTWEKEDMTAYIGSHDIEGIKQRIGTLLPNNFAWDFLQSIGVSGIAYPWAVLEHYGNEQEMIIKMDMDPEADAVKWNQTSWAPFLDAATSVGSSIFFKSRKMRIVSAIDQVQFISSDDPPKVGYLYVEEVTDEKSLAANISVLGLSGEVLAKLSCMRFSDVEVVSDHVTGIDALCYQMTWIPPIFAEMPIKLAHVLMISEGRSNVAKYMDQLVGHVKSLVQISSSEDVIHSDAQRVLKQRNTIVIYVPGQVELMAEVPHRAHAFTWEAACLVKRLSALPILPRLFILTANVQKGVSTTALANSALHGFARIAAQEHPEIWGGLIDSEDTNFPLLALKYVQGEDVIQVSDGLPRVARLRPLTMSRHRDATPTSTLLPKPHGTYLVTGGFGDLGLEVLDFLSRKGARRIVVVSRSKLPPRRKWRQLSGQMRTVICRIEEIERRGTTVYSIALDMGWSEACKTLTAALDALSLPPVLGIVHAAGVSEDGLIRDTTSESFERVFRPKVSGALALHDAFPPGAADHPLDFFVLFSSIGQLIGTPGQAPYGAANAFLDALAAHRRAYGDNCVAFQWTAWRGKGLARDAKFLNEELRAKGITDITCEEGFKAWEEVDGLDTGHVVVTRSRVLGEDEEVPFPLTAEIVRRRRGVEGTMQKASSTTSGEDLKLYVRGQIRQCLGTVLHLEVEDIDDRAAIADLGVDSVIGAALRRELQTVLGVKIGLGFLWKVDTVGKLDEWAYDQIRGKEGNE
ncbi:hypothetical protein DM02DRAFT_208403 [Periconia macrospinosa]|uniref:PKS/mFAS DH domain-containing protein n=1 Tax=Periconia macrospinosa TaxID=97972 RepID=A0A2V1E148_9PLEO|nr:hypothetical protein DM02DRAFT_208403 [Periconia macrospinosa]